MSERRRTIAGVVLALGVFALVWWLTQTRAPERAVEPAVRTPPPARQQVAAVAPGSAPVPALAPPASDDRVLRFEGGPGVKVAGLPVHIRGWCRTSGTEVTTLEADVTVDGDGHARLPGSFRECGLFASTSADGVGLTLEEDRDLVLARSVLLTVTVLDPAGSPVAGASIEGSDNPVPGALVHHTDGSGRWEGPWAVVDDSLSLVVSADGFTTVPVNIALAPQATHQDALVRLQRGRRVTVNVEAPGSRLLGAMGLWVEAPGTQADLQRRLDAPGRFELPNASTQTLTVSLREEVRPDRWSRPLAEVSVPAGVGPAEATLTLTPRRLEVCVDEVDVKNVQAGEVRPGGTCASSIDVRCEGAHRLLLRPARNGDGHSGCARLEYAPTGPCVVTRASCDDAWPTDPNSETVTVTPPGSITLHRRAGH